MAAEACSPVAARRSRAAGARDARGRAIHGTWSIYEWLDGETGICRDRSQTAASLATDLAQFVGALQRIDAAERAAAEPAQRVPGRAAGDARRDTRASIAALGSTIDAEAVNRRVGSRPARTGVAARRRSGSTETSTLATCWPRRAGSAPSSTGAVSAWAIPPATWRWRGRCSLPTRAMSSGQRSRSTTRPGRAAEAGCSPRR